MDSVSFRDRQGEPVRVDPAAVRALREELAGGSLAPGEPGYDEARQIWNAMIQRRPALIARCDDAADAARCVRFARDHGVALTVRGGGHNIAGRALAEGGLLVDFSHRRRVEVDASARRAHVEPGATLADVDAATTPHGLLLPSGIVSETGIAGLTVGGGFGWLSRRYGLTCDHLEAVELVTGEGEVLTADQREHPELFWSLRGAGGGAAVVTQFHYRLRLADDEMTCGLIVRRAEESEAVTRRFGELTDAASEELTYLLVLRNAPPAPFLPEELHGRPIAGLAVCHGGNLETAAREVAPARDFGDPVADLVDRKPFVEHQQMLDPLQPKGRRYYWKSEYLDRFDEETAAVLREHAARIPSPHAAILVFQLGGAVARNGAQTSAAHRDARFIVNVAGAWEDADDDEENVAWVRDCWRNIHRIAGRGGYVNFLTEDSGEDEREQSQAGVDLARLERVRRRYDPDGVVR